MNVRWSLSLSVAFTVASLTLASAADGTKSALETAPEGWVDLLKDAGPTLKSWTRVSIPPTAPLRKESPWTLDEMTGIVHCDGRNLHEWLRFDREFGDAIYHVEWRFVPVTEGKKGYNSGIYVRNSSDGVIWHQAQMGGAPTTFLFGVSPRGGVNNRTSTNTKNAPKCVKPPGEWNVFEVTCKGQDLTLWSNGTVAAEWKGCEVAKGYVGLEAEGYQIEFRKVMIKPLD